MAYSPYKESIIKYVNVGSIYVIRNGNRVYFRDGDFSHRKSLALKPA